MLVLVVNSGSSSLKYQVREVLAQEGGEPSAYTSSMPRVDELVNMDEATQGAEGGSVITEGLI